MPKGPGEIEYRSPEGETFYGPPGVELPEGWTELRTPPAEGEIRATPASQGWLDLLQDVLGVPRYEDPATHWLAAGLGAATGAATGRGAGNLLSKLSKVRVAGAGRQADATRLGRVLEESVPPLAPIKPGAEGLAEIAGSAGKTRLSAYTDAERAGMATNLPTSGSGVGFANPRQQFEALLAELREAGTVGYNAGGVARDTLPGATARRTREEITEDILKLLEAENPGLAAQFRASQGVYARGAEMQRALKPERVLGPRGFNQGELQRTVGQRLKTGGASYDPEVLKAVFRGGAPPRGDRSLGLPISLGGRFRIPLGLEYLAGPGRPFNLDPYGALLGALGGAGLSEALE